MKIRWLSQIRFARQKKRCRMRGTWRSSSRPTRWRWWRSRRSDLAAPAGSLASFAALKTFAMTTAQKYALAGACALAAGLALYEGNVLRHQRAAAAALRAQITGRDAEIARLRATRETVNARLAVVEGQIDARV